MHVVAGQVYHLIKDFFEKRLSDMTEERNIEEKIEYREGDDTQKICFRHARTVKNILMRKL